MTDISIEERVSRLERSVSLWRRATIGLVALGGAGLVLGAAFKPKSMKLDRLTVSEEIVVGDAGGQFVAIGAVTSEKQDVSERSTYVDNRYRGAYLNVRGGSIGSALDLLATEGAAEMRIGTTGAQIFMESAGEPREGSTRFQLHTMGGPKAMWSFGTRPGEGVGFVNQNGERTDLVR